MDVRTATDTIRVAAQPRSIVSESGVREPRDGQSVSQPVSNAAAESGLRTGGAPEEAATRSGPSGDFYISPLLTYDARSLTVIFQIRDTESGDVTRQFPAEEVVERYRQDPSSRPFVLPEPAETAEDQAGPPPPTIGGPVAAAASEAEQEAGGATVLAEAPQGAQQTASPSTSDSSTAALSTAAAGTGAESLGQPSSAPVRPSVDLIA